MEVSEFDARLSERINVGHVPDHNFHHKVTSTWHKFRDLIMDIQSSVLGFSILYFLPGKLSYIGGNAPSASTGSIHVPSFFSCYLNRGFHSP